MSLSPVAQGAQSPEVSMPSIRLKLDNTFASIQEEGKSGNMKVFARVRPMLQREEDAGYLECVGVIDEQVVRAIVPKTSAKYKCMSQNGQEIYEDFTYSEAFGPETGQFVFFRKTVLDIMQGFIEGQNCLLFSYGITNSGKTYTLQGTESDPGIIPLAMKLFFASMKHQLLEGISVKPDKFADILMLTDQEMDNETRLRDQFMQLADRENADLTNSTASLKKAFNWCACFEEDFEFETETSLPAEEMKAAQSAMYMKEQSKQSADQQSGLCSIWISFVEIYNEYIYDLLQPNVLKRERLALGEDQNGDVYVKGAREICVSTSEEALKLLSLGRRNLRIAATKLNYQSSRSHCIYTVKVVRMVDEDIGRVNRISFCDLAGSERAAKSQTTGIHLKEAGFINTSILVLGKCLEQLRLNQNLRDKKMIPLRESKLTRLFSGHFLGKGRTVMIANASPCEYTFDETLNVLRFSALLKTVKLNDSYLSTVSTSLGNITSQFAKSRANLSISRNESLDESFSEDIQERDEMIEKLLDLADSLRANLEKEKTEKAELESKIRLEVYTEASTYSDRLLEEQKRISDNYIESLKELYETRISDLNATSEKRISDLLTQLQEYENSYEDESSMSINKGNATRENEDGDGETSKILFASPAPDQKYSFASPLPVMQIGNHKNDSASTPIPSPRGVPPKEEISSDEIKSLQEQLESVNKELESVKEQLELSSEKLKTAETEASLAIEECSSLKLKLQKAEEVLADTMKELETLKSESLGKDNRLECLVHELKSSEGEVSRLSEDLKKATCMIDELKEEKNKAAENYSHELQQIEQKVFKNDTALKELQQELADGKLSLNELLKKISELESKYTVMETENAKLEAEKSELEEKLAATLQQLGTDDVESKCQLLNQQLEELQKLVEDKENKVNSLQEQCAALKSVNSELTQTLEAEKENHSSVTEKYNATKVEVEQLSEKLNTEMDMHSKAMDESKLNMFESQEKCSELVMQLEERNSKLSKLELDCAEYQTKNEELLRNIQTLEEECVLLKDKLALKENCQENEYQVESILEQLGEAKLKNNALEEKCSDISSQLSKALQDKEEKVLKISHLENQVKELDTNLENSNILIAELNCKIGELESDCASYKKVKEDDSDLTNKLEELKTECDLHKSNYEKVYENYQTVEIAFSTLTKENGSLRTDYEQLKQIKISEAEAYEKTIKELEKSISEKERVNKEFTDIVQNLENSILEFKTKEVDIASCKEVIANLKEELEQAKLLQKESVDEYEKVSAKNEEFVQQISELEEVISGKEIRLQELIEEIENFKADIHNKELEITTHKEEVDSLKAALEKATLLQEQSVQLEEVSAKKDEYVEKIKELEEAISKQEITIQDLQACIGNCQSDVESKENSIESYKKEVDALKAKLEEKNTLLQEQADVLGQLEEVCAKNEELEKNMAEMNEGISKKEVEIASYIEELENLKTELEKAKLLQEQSDMLCLSLQKCELAASNKIKFLNSCVVKYQDEIADMRRQMKEKTDSIGELEKALCESQKQIKDMQAKISKQVEEKRQDAARIEQILHEKKVAETENYKLKVDLKKAQERESLKAFEEAETSVDSTKDEVKQSSNTISKGRKKRSLSDITKEANDDVDFKENTKSTNKVQEKKSSKTAKVEPVKTEEIETVSKRRRVLRTQQPKTVVDLNDTFESEKDEEEEYVPTKKTSSKSSLRQKKTKSKEVEPPKQRASRRKLQEQQENMSPVKKAMNFVGSKIRSVAQTVSSMPSPRVTRGRKKLFNADASEPKWRP